MPEVDGWAVASAVKEHKPGTHVVMLTGWAGEIAPEDFKKRGVDVILAKPCGRVELEGAIGALLAPRPTEGLDVLLVDDEPGLVAIVRQLLERSGAAVTTAHGGKAAVTAAQDPESTFDVVITDLDMPEVDGWAVASAVKEQPISPTPRTWCWSLATRPK